MSTVQRDVADHEDRMKHHLEQALDEADDSQKNYHIKSALQSWYLMMMEDDGQR